MSLDIEKFFKVVNTRVDFPDDIKCFNAWAVYKPSYQSELFLSEENRNIYAEAFAYPENEDESQNKNIPKLSDIVINFIAKTYRSGPLNPRIIGYDFVRFGKNCDIDLPLIDIIELNNEIYWQRVVEKKCKNRLLYHKLRNAQNPNWKQLGIATKLIEIIENTKPDDWKTVEYENLVSRCSKYVKYIEIQQLLPTEDRYTVLPTPDAHILNYPFENCHHGSLEFLSGLKYLKEFSIQFSIGNLEHHYHQKYFEFSFQDIHNLMKGLRDLNFLETFRIHSSKLNDNKLKIITRGLQTCPIKCFEVSYCGIGDESGDPIAEFIKQHATLKILELKGNYLRSEGVSAIGCGIKNFMGELEYLGLAKNPIGASGVKAIGAGFFESNHVKKLNLMGCEIDGAEGAFRAAQIIGFHDKLVEYNMSCLPLGYEGGEKIIEALTSYHNVCELEVRGCGLTVNQIAKIKLLTARNRYYRDNPCLNKDFIQESDIPEIKAWVSRIKNPLLLNSLKEIEDFKLVKRYELQHETLPTFLDSKYKHSLTNSDILGINFMDCFAFDQTARRSILRKTQNIGRDKKSYEFIPNNLNKSQFLDHAIVGKDIDMNSTHYFK